MFIARSSPFAGEYELALWVRVACHNLLPGEPRPPRGASRTPKRNTRTQALTFALSRPQ